MANKAASLLPALLFVAALGGAFVWVAMKEGKSSSSSDPTSPPPAFKYCWASELSLDDAGTARLRVNPETEGFESKPLDGNVNVKVSHEVPVSPDAGYVPDPVPGIDVCSMRVPMAASAYGDAGVRLEGKLGPCAMPPADRIVKVGVSLELGDAGNGSWCEFVDRVPSALGGKDLTFDEQRTAYYAAIAAKDHPEELAKVRDFIGTLARVASAVDPALRPKVTSCGPDVTGTVPVVSWEVLSRIVSPTLDGGKLPAPALDPEKVLYSDLSGGTPTLGLLVPGWDLHPAEVAERLQPLSRFVVVLTSLATVAPIVDIPERMSGQSVVEAHFTPGSYHGGMWVVDRTTGKVACTAPVIAESSNAHYESTNPNDLSRSARSDLASQVWRDLKARLAKSAPGLVLETLVKKPE